MSSVKREKITGGMKLMDMIVIMSEGNPGAISVLTWSAPADACQDAVALLFAFARRATPPGRAPDSGLPQTGPAAVW